MGTTRPESPVSLEQQVRAALPDTHGGHTRIAYSGGLDSTVLLHLLRNDAQVTAVHVNHGMQAQADAWQQHCEYWCAQWQVPLQVCAVVPDICGGGPEASARDARYAAMAEIMQPGDVLLTAQHARDQAETFLLQALRGAGIHGLAGMPAVAEFAAGRIARPLLKISRQDLQEYAQQHALQWVEDPSNADLKLARAFLRQRISPALDQYWPGFEQRLSRAAAWCADATRLTDELAAMDSALCQGPVEKCLSINKLMILSAPRQDNLIRYWLRQLQLPAPDHRHMQAVRELLETHQHAAHPVVSWANCELRRYQQWLFAMSALAPPPGDCELSWDGCKPLQLPPDCGRLEVRAAISTGSLSVRFRQGGERLQLNGRSHHTRLKQVLQVAKIPDWVRARLPLVFYGDKIIAVADFWQSDQFFSDTDTSRPCLQWQGAPPGAGLASVVADQAFS